LARCERRIFPAIAGRGELIQMKWYCLLLLLWPATAEATTPIPLIEIYRDTPDIQDDYIISSAGDHEELAASANVVWLPRQDYGRYARPPTDFPAQVDKLESSIAGTGYTMPEQRTVDLRGWHVRIKGEEIDAWDPRYEKVFDLLDHEMKKDGWRPKDVTVLQLKRFTLLVARLQYSGNPSRLTRPHIERQTLDGLETCPNVVNDHLACHLTHGFVLLAKPDERHN
jgi:hypothetical protein